MAMGMTCEDYWEKPQRYAKYFLDAHTLKKQQINEELWLQGAYIYEAFSVVIGNFGMALSGKKSQRKEYTKKPYDFLPKLEWQQEEAVKKEQQKALDSFKRMKAYWDQKNGTQNNRP